jgi:4-hydroxybenzoate polyprenyltransferase
MIPSTTLSSASSSTGATQKIRTFLDMIKFAHSVFALPFALIAAFWAFRQIHISPFSTPGLGRLGLILACMILARTWAMTANRLLDRAFDAANPRTATRPSVTGAISPAFMRFTLALCLLLFTLATSCFRALYGNPWPLILALPVLAWLAGYSLTKRFTILCHFWLGASLGLAPIAAWIALAPPHVSLTDPKGLTILLLGTGVMFWVAGFDILYALQDEDFDRREELHSIPAALGRRHAITLSRICHAITLLAFLAVGITGHFHLLFWLGFLCAAILLLIEQSLVSPTDISKINLAFMTANGLIGLLFGTLAIADTLLL